MHFRYFIAAWIMASLCINPSLQAAEGTAGKQVRVISYNVQFLPGIAALANRRGQPTYRAQAIGKQLANYDIIGLNELFESKPREQILAEIEQVWGKDYSSLFSPKLRPDRFTGGLAIISRYPFLETNIHTYTQSSSPEKYGLLADGYATKGILHARISLSSDQKDASSVDVFVTHLEAREPAIRPSQYAEFAQFLKQHSSPERPAVLMGDFNTRGDQEEMSDAQSAYNQMTKGFQQARPESVLIDLWPAIGQGPGGTSDQSDEDGGRRIDYIFALNPKPGSTQLKPRNVLVNRFLDPQVVALSDHSAVEAQFDWLP